MSVSGAIFFALCAAVAIGAALGTVMARSPLRAAMALLFHIIALAGLYLALHAHLLAALQLIIYAGAVVVLFVFVIMLLGPSAITEGTLRALSARAFGAGLMIMVVGVLAFTLFSVKRAPRLIRDCEGASSSECTQFGSVEAFAGELFGKQKDGAIVQGALVPFELVSVLLLVAIVGAMTVARGGRLEAQKKPALSAASHPVAASPGDANASIEGGA